MEKHPQNGQEGVVRLLLEHGASPDPQTEDGLTPLWLVAQGGHADVVAMLHRKGG